VSGLSIIGSGHYVPGRPYTNHDLARVLDTNDAWIRQRTGIAQRHFAGHGQGPCDLALPAAQRALESAGIAPTDLDYILFNTMTPDNLFPGSAPVLASRLGCGTIPALDLRTQCAAMIYSFQVADSLLRSGAARRILIVGAEAHAAVMPWDWEALESDGAKQPSPESYELATKHRGWDIIFGDGAGALVVERGAEGTGVIAVDLQSDGRYAGELCVPAGFRRGKYLDATVEDLYLHMQGREVFKHAVTKLPRSINAVCERAGLPSSAVDWFVAHQANQRINEAVCSKLAIDPERMPSNIERFGNTSSGTIPILIDEMRRDGRWQANKLVCLTALGAGFHWGSLLLRT
jgi:3-oxoacyl-[acyl-carrier-protein] synthase III